MYFSQSPAALCKCMSYQEGNLGLAQLGLVGVLWAARGRGKKEPDMTRQLWGSGSVGIRRGRRGSVEVWKCGSGSVGIRRRGNRAVTATDHHFPPNFGPTTMMSATKVQQVAKVDCYLVQRRPMLAKWPRLD